MGVAGEAAVAPSRFSSAGGRDEDDIDRMSRHRANTAHPLTPDGGTQLVP
jgi:hypothetical protein